MDENTITHEPLFASSGPRHGRLGQNRIHLSWSAQHRGRRPPRALGVGALAVVSRGRHSLHAVLVLAHEPYAARDFGPVERKRLRAHILGLDEPGPGLFAGQRGRCI